MIPSVAIERRSEATTGCVSNRTNPSPQFGESRTISAEPRPLPISSESRVFACRSATCRASASFVVSVSNFPFGLSPGISTSRSTIASAIASGRPRLSAVARNSFRT